MYKKLILPHSAGIALSLLFLANAPARADLIQWGYNWEPSSAKLVANAGGAGYLGLTDEPANSAKGSSNTVVTNLHTFSTAPYNTPDIYHNDSVKFNLLLTDKASGKSGSVSFSGYFSGSTTGSSANIQFTATSPTTETLTLGGNKYTVALGMYTPPGPPGASNAGSLNATVTVAPINSGGGGGIASAPEPGALTLAGLAFPFLGLSAWRRRAARKKA